MDELAEKVLSLTIRRKVLEQLIKKGEATAYEISKELSIPDAAVGKHLSILQEVGLVNPPEIDVSGGRLKKIYKPSKNAIKVLKEFWKKELEAAPEIIKDICKEVNKNG